MIGTFERAEIWKMEGDGQCQAPPLPAPLKELDFDGFYHLHLFTTKVCFVFNGYFPLLTTHPQTRKARLFLSPSTEKAGSLAAGTGKRRRDWILGHQPRMPFLGIKTCAAQVECFFSMLRLEIHQRGCKKQNKKQSKNSCWFWLIWMIFADVFADFGSFWILFGWFFPKSHQLIGAQEGSPLHRRAGGLFFGRFWVQICGQKHPKNLWQPMKHWNSYDNLCFLIHMNSQGFWRFLSRPRSHKLHDPAAAVCRSTCRCYDPINCVNLKFQTAINGSNKGAISYQILKRRFFWNKNLLRLSCWMG